MKESELKHLQQREEILRVVNGLRYLDISNTNRALSPLSRKGLSWKDRGSSDYTRIV